MKKFTKICLISAAIFFIIGITACIAGGLMGAGSRVKQMWNNGELQRWNWDWNVEQDGIRFLLKNDSDWKNARESIQTFPAEDIKKLKVSLRYGSLSMEEGEGTDVIVRMEKDDGKCQVSVKDGVLSLEDKRKNSVNGRDYKIILELPKNMELETITMDNNAGNMDWEDMGLKAKTADIQVDAGEIHIEGLQTEKFSLEVGAGNADIESLDAQNISVTCGLGNIDMILFGKEEDYNYKVNCGLGNIDVNEQSYTSVGKEMEIDYHAERELRLDCGLGNITVETKQK